jgi:hypothetical protein
MRGRVIRVTVSGSFRRAMAEVQATVYSLTDMGVTVLSPADPRVIDEVGAFLFVASDRLRSVRLVQQRHLQAIGASHFLWLVAPDGYLGVSAAMEVGYATAVGTPVFAADRPRDLTLRQFVTVVRDLKEAVNLVRRSGRRPPDEGLLVDPAAAIAAEHTRLDGLEQALLKGRTSDAEILSAPLMPGAPSRRP